MPPVAWNDVEARGLVDRLPVVVHQAPVLGSRAGVRELHAAHRRETARQPYADFARQRERVEVALVERQLVGDEVVPVAAAAIEGPPDAHPHFGTGPSEQEVAGGRGRNRARAGLRRSARGCGQEGDKDRETGQRGGVLHQEADTQSLDQSSPSEAGRIGDGRALVLAHVTSGAVGGGARYAVRLVRTALLIGAWSRC